MNGALQIELPKPSTEKPPRFSLLSLLVMLALVASFVFYFWIGRGPANSLPHQVHLPFGPAEQAYAKNIAFQGLRLNRAENFLHQEITSLVGEIVNGGDRSVRDVEVTVTYLDELHQVVLRESRVLFGRAVPSLPPGGHREFELSYEHIPASWNRELPVVSTSGVEF